MSQRPNGDIVKVAWHQNRHSQFQVVFADGREEAVPTPPGMSDRNAAEDLANARGFILTSDPLDDHLAEWSRNQN